MASKPQFNMAKMLFSTLVPPLQRRQSEPATRLRFPSPCEYQGHDACTGVDCDCACHLVESSCPWCKLESKVKAGGAL